jgi:hypothetical protein
MFPPFAERDHVRRACADRRIRAGRGKQVRENPRHLPTDIVEARIFGRLVMLAHQRRRPRFWRDRLGHWITRLEK